MSSRRLLLEEAERRRRERERHGVITEAILAELFKQQVDFVLDPSREKAALCTRRAGKTAMWSRYSVIKALAQPQSLIRIWAVNRLRAKQLLWTELLGVCARHRIPVKPHETELTIRFENGSEVRLLGADKDKEVQKKRGDRTDMEVVLEAQGFTSFLRPLVEDVAQPCLVDRRGVFCLEGTPGPVQAGYWFAVSGNEPFASRWTSPGVTQASDLVGAGWSMHRWSLFDNPHLPHAREEVERIKTKRRWADDNPTYVREYLGRWVSDLGALFYAFDPVRNLYDPNVIQPYGPGWLHTLGWDLGSRDDMALVAWGYHADLPDLYEAFSWKKPGASADEVVAQIDALEQRGFVFSQKVADTGGGGRMYVEEVMRRYSHHFDAAKKSEKYEHVRMMNDDFRGGFLKLMPGSAYAEEVAQLARDQDWPPEDKPDAKPREDPRCANHCCFIAGTKVLTRDGDVSIEDLQVGAEVLTRAGWRKVIKTAPTGVKPTIESSLGLIGTPEHPVWTENRGWVRLDEIVATDVVLYAWNLPASSRSSESTGTGSPTPHAGTTACITSPASAASPSTFTERFGAVLVDRFPKVTTSTTGTGTPSTTGSPTSSASAGRSTYPSMLRSALAGTLRACVVALNWLARRPQSGTPLLRGASGTARTVSKSCASALWWSAAAMSAERLFAPSGPRLAFAGTTATLESAGRAALTTWTAPASSAPESSASTSTTPSSWCARGPALVFAVSVEGQHEFFANGVLVSNCDSALYSWRAAQHYLHRAEVAMPQRGTSDWMKQEEEKMLQRIMQSNQRAWWEPREPGQ